MSIAPVLIPYQDVRHAIRSGDLLLFRKRRIGLLGNVIALAGRGVHSHAAKAAWWSNELFCLEVREFYGGRAVSLSSQVERYPSRIDVFRPNPDNRWPQYDLEKSLEIMRRFAGGDYGYGNVFLAALTHLPFFRVFIRPNRNDHEIFEGKRPPFCSQAVSLAERLAGVDPVSHLADRFTEPADLARSPFYQYLYTLK